MSVAATERDWLSELQTLVTNPLDAKALRGRRLAAILGDTPSTYAKSPKLWNAAFRALELGAVYVPLDVPRERLPRVVELLRGCEAFLGGSVTVPYKMEILPLLDEADPITARIGAVNVIVRTNDGRLVGSNTDGLGGVRALTEASSGAAAISRLANARALLIGAGGAAQAVAFYLWEQMSDGELLIANRTRAGAEGLAKRLSEMRPGRVSAIAEEAVAERVAWTDLVINASVKGQAGIRKLADGRWTCLEPYSALAPAQPSALVPSDSGDHAEFLQQWYRASISDIQRNHQASLQVCAKLPKSAVCYDIIYAPLETPFLRHARWSGHRTLNGRTMNLLQAVEAFDAYVCREWLEQLGRRGPETRNRILQAMSEEWGK